MIDRLAVGLVLASLLPLEAAFAAQDNHNLKCAAMISAADQWVVRGTVDKDAGISRNDALVGSMTHMNMYAIPKGIEEKEAFRQVKALRIKLIKSVSPEDTIVAAKKCLTELG